MLERAETSLVMHSSVLAHACGSVDTTTSFSEDWEVSCCSAFSSSGTSDQNITFSVVFLSQWELLVEAAATSYPATIQKIRTVANTSASSCHIVSYSYTGASPTAFSEWYLPITGGSAEESRCGLSLASSHFADLYGTVVLQNASKMTPILHSTALMGNPPNLAVAVPLLDKTRRCIGQAAAHVNLSGIAAQVQAQLVHLACDAAITLIDPSGSVLFLATAERTAFYSKNNSGGLFSEGLLSRLLGANSSTEFFDKPSEQYVAVLPLRSLSENTLFRVVAVQSRSSVTDPLRKALALQWMFGVLLIVVAIVGTLGFAYFVLSPLRAIQPEAQTNPPVLSWITEISLIQDGVQALKAHLRELSNLGKGVSRTPSEFSSIDSLPDQNPLAARNSPPMVHCAFIYLHFGCVFLPDNDKMLHKALQTILTSVQKHNGCVEFVDGAGLLAVFKSCDTRFVEHAACSTAIEISDLITAHPSSYFPNCVMCLHAKDCFEETFTAAAKASGKEYRYIFGAEVSFLESLPPLARSIGTRMLCTEEIACPAVIPSHTWGFMLVDTVIPRLGSTATIRLYELDPMEGAAEFAHQLEEGFRMMTRGQYPEAQEIFKALRQQHAHVVARSSQCVRLERICENAKLTESTAHYVRKRLPDWEGDR